MTGTSHQNMRLVSISKIVDAMRNGATIKSEIFQMTGLSWGACNTITNELNAAKIIKSVLSKDDTVRGRNKTKYSFNRKEFLIFGVEPRVDEVLCSITTLGNEEIFRKIYPQKNELNINTIQEAVISSYIDSLINAKIKSDSIIAICFALAGGVDSNNLKWLNSPRIDGIDNYDFKDILKMFSNIKYHFIEHDIHAKASSVVKFNNWDEDDYVFIDLGRGVASSIFTNGILHGSRGFAGEIGNIPYMAPVANSEIMHVEQAISLSGLTEFVNWKFNTKYKSFSEISLDIFQSEEYLNHVYRIIEYIVIVTTNILDPATIIIGGSSIEPIFDVITSRIEKNVRSKTWNNGPDKILWYHENEVYGAYGTIINNNEEVTNKIIADFLL